MTKPSLPSLKPVVTNVASTSFNLSPSKWVTHSWRRMLNSSSSLRGELLSPATFDNSHTPRWSEAQFLLTLREALHTIPRTLVWRLQLGRQRESSDEAHSGLCADCRFIFRDNLPFGRGAINGSS